MDQFAEGQVNQQQVGKGDMSYQNPPCSRFGKLRRKLRTERQQALDISPICLYLDLANASFGREVLRCDSLAQSPGPGVQVVDGCVNPQAIRYMLPALGLRAVF